MKVLNSGRYICKIIYNICDDNFPEDVKMLFEKQPFSICHIHVRKGNLWFHAVEKCGNQVLDFFKLTNPRYDNKDPPDEYYDPFCGFIFSYNESSELYECKNQFLKNRGGNKWNLYLEIYKRI